MRSPSTASIRIGARIVSADGKELGIVKDTHVDRFLVSVRWAPDYWLGTETVDYITDDMVQLFITKGAVGAAKLRGLEVSGPS